LNGRFCSALISICTQLYSYEIDGLYKLFVISFVKLHWIIEVKADKKRRASVYIKFLMETKKIHRQYKAQRTLTKGGGWCGTNLWETNN
jgi:hypothetical protein